MLIWAGFGFFYAAVVGFACRQGCRVLRGSQAYHCSPLCVQVRTGFFRIRSASDLKVIIVVENFCWGRCVWPILEFSGFVIKVFSFIISVQIVFHLSLATTLLLVPWVIPWLVWCMYPGCLCPGCFFGRYAG